VWKLILCIAVLCLLPQVKSAGNAEASIAAHGFTAPKLKYELVVQTKLQQAVAQTVNVSDANAAATAAAVAFDSAWPTVHVPQPSDLKPHLRTHPKTMLILPDFSGESLLAHMLPHRDWRLASMPTTVSTSSSSTPTSNSSGSASANSGASPALANRVFLPASQTQPTPMTPAAAARLRALGTHCAPGVACPLSLRPVCAALRSALAVATELMRLHESGLVHRALESSSILLHAPSGRIQFLDLSSASALVKDTNLTNVSTDSSVALNSCHYWQYASPEQSGKGVLTCTAETENNRHVPSAHSLVSCALSFPANRSIDARSDLYSLGQQRGSWSSGRRGTQRHSSLVTVY
jgi:hypothetical protein